MTALFEDKLRGRIMSVYPVHPDALSIRMTGEERDALADAVEALREIACWVFSGDDPEAIRKHAEAALARLDAA